MKMANDSHWANRSRVNNRLMFVCMICLYNLTLSSMTLCHRLLSFCID